MANSVPNAVQFEDLSSTAPALKHTPKNSRHGGKQGRAYAVLNRRSSSYNLQEIYQSRNLFGDNPPLSKELLGECERVFEQINADLNAKDNEYLRETIIKAIRLFNLILYTEGKQAIKIEDLAESKQDKDFFTNFLDALSVDLDDSTKRDLKKLLKSHFITNFSDLNSKENKVVFKQYVSKEEISNLSSEDEVTRLISEIIVLWKYKEGIAETFKPDHRLSSDVMRILYEKNVSEADVAKKIMERIINDSYIKAINRRLLEKMKRVIQKEAQHASIDKKNCATTYTTFAEQIQKSITSFNLSNILDEFQRNVFGGLVEFRINGMEAVAPFDRDRDDIQQWVKAAEEWAGEHIFNDKTLVTRVSAAIGQVTSLSQLAKEENPKASSSKSNDLETHARNFGALMKVWSIPKEKETIIKELIDILKISAGIVNIEEAIDYILMLHRFGTQVILLSALTEVLNTHKHFFSTVRNHSSITQSTMASEKEHDSKSIILNVTHVLETTFIYKRAFKRYPTSQIIQKIVVVQPLPGKSIGDVRPISVQFSFVPPPGLPAEDMKNFDQYISELDFVIRAKGFPPFLPVHE